MSQPAALDIRIVRTKEFSENAYLILSYSLAVFAISSPHIAKTPTLQLP